MKGIVIVILTFALMALSIFFGYYTGQDYYRQRILKDIDYQIKQEQLKSMRLNNALKEIELGLDEVVYVEEMD